MLNNYQKSMLEVKNNINKIIENDNEDINSIIQNYFSITGKGVRPLLTLICSNLGKYNKDVLSIASIIEIIHTTTLIHDDIIDKALERRGNITLNNIYGNKKALFIGDFLFARVLKEMSKLENYELHKYLTKTLKEICIGEIIQNNNLFNTNVRIIDYLKKIKRKTAMLISFSCVAGAICSNAKMSDIIACYKFGHFLGMSYQIMDDYLDFAVDKETFGKDVGQDLLNGNFTFPIILKFLKDKNRFNDFKNMTIEEKNKLIFEIKNDNEILDATKKLSNKYLEKAKVAIERIDEKTKNDLLFILNKMANRNF